VTERSGRAELERLRIWLELLEQRHGPLPELPDVGADLEPSWGPLGSLARRLLSPEEVAHLVAWDADLSPGMHRRDGQSPVPRGPGW